MLDDITTIDIREFPGRHTNNAVSPFRYPGGKGFLSGYLSHHIHRRFSGTKIVFVEPFCGGAGAALNLLADGHVSEVHLNDADERIYSAWSGMLLETERFVEAIETTPLDISEWHKQAAISLSAKPGEYDFAVGFASFYMNRTTRSGIVTKAGPIGGYDQSGKWNISARFNRSGLVQRVKWIGENAARINISNSDVLSFLDKSRRRLNLNRTLFFIDPPYVKAGGRLYLNAMDEDKHVALSDLLISGKIPNWILTYDDNSLIHKIYSKECISRIQVNYSLQNKRKEHEVLIQPNAHHYDSAAAL